MKAQTNITDLQQLFKMIKLLVFCSCLAVIWGAAVPHTIGDQELIVGGVNTSISEVPYQVALIVLNRFRCGGSILTPKYILTAAHCIWHVDSDVSIRAGSSLHMKGGVVVQATRAVYHPQFSFKTMDYDVGIIEVSNPLNFTTNIQPIKLVTTPPPDGALVKVSGWGYTEPYPPLSNWLQSVEIPMVNREKCEKMYAPQIKITPRMNCAGAKGKSQCRGDSGGPVTYKGRLAGIVSFGKGCGGWGIPKVHTNIANEEIRDFIKQFVPVD